MDWVDPEKSEPFGTKYKTFHSKTIDGDVSYLVYCPPGYEERQTPRYPVLDTLHASGGTPARTANVLPRFDTGHSSGKIPPMILVFPNGLRGATMYSDTKDGLYPVESVIVKDLIPHVDASYRTIARGPGVGWKASRVGGFGPHSDFGFKYPEVFGVVSIRGARPARPRAEAAAADAGVVAIVPVRDGGDLDYFRENDPFALIPRNADTLRDQSSSGSSATSRTRTGWPRVREAAQGPDGPDHPPPVPLPVEREVAQPGAGDGDARRRGVDVLRPARSPGCRIRREGGERREGARGDGLLQPWLRHGTDRRCRLGRFVVHEPSDRKAQGQPFQTRPNLDASGLSPHLPLGFNRWSIFFESFNASFMPRALRSPSTGAPR